MAFARVDETLIPVSTTLVNENIETVSTHMVDPSNGDEPIFRVQITLERKHEIRWRVTGEVQEEWPVRSYTIAPDQGCDFRIPIEAVALPVSCIRYLALRISDFGLDAAFCNNLASKIASHSYGLIRQRCRGFHVSAHLCLVDVDIEEVGPWEIRPRSDSEGGVVPRGASELKKLKKESFYMKQGQGHGGSSSGTSCVVCLDDFSSSVKLTKLPACSHSFHEKCIFQWLRDSKSCPLCRTDVE